MAARTRNCHGGAEDGRERDLRSTLQARASRSMQRSALSGDARALLVRKSAMDRHVLTEEQVEHFLEHGYVTVRLFARRRAAVAARVLGPARLRRRRSVDLGRARVHMPSPRQSTCGTSRRRPGARRADLVGGAERSSSRTRGTTASSSTSGGRGRPWAAVGRGAGLAQGRRLLPALPRLARAGPADARAVVGRGAPGRRDVRRGRLGRPGGAASSPRTPRASPPDDFAYADLVAQCRLRRGDRRGGRRLPAAPVHAAREVAEPPRRRGSSPTRR